ncbi:Npun_F0494 family protein [Egbenema bharatensis]|uniref:Npun_F0494 family protein n=1 Tax=Egbenema bharatensis TaxID=3463334 RepID=UPI003A858571
MTSTSPNSQRTTYSPTTILRAERAARCTPFQLPLFCTMQRQSVGLRAIAGKTGVQNGYTAQSISELTAENALLWLIQVGLLRREVDGQGLTDSFRLTPLGHQLVNQWQQGGDTLPPPSVGDRLYNACHRWVRFPAWLQ